MVLGCWPPGSCSVLRQQSASSLLSSALELRIFSREWFISFTFSNYVYFALFTAFSHDFVNLCCVCCHVLSLLLMVLISAFSALLIILIGCLLGLLFSRPALGFCHCSLLFTFSLISTVRVSFRWWHCLSFMVSVVLLAFSFESCWHLLFTVHVLCGL